MARTGSLENVVPTLETPSERLRAAFIEMAMEFKEQGNPRYVQDAEDFAGFLSRVRDDAEGPVSRFWLVHDGQILGSSRLRHALTPELEHEGGNIGYDIRPSARRRGFGTMLLRLTLERALARGLARVRITCDADNVGSIRVIEKNGGVLDGEVLSRERGSTMIRQYWISLTGARKGRPTEPC
jgi:predicted acetyltransferase